MNVRLKSRGEATMSWIGAHTLFALAEVIAVLTGLKSYRHDHILLFAFVLPFMGIMPWLLGVVAVRRYKRMVAPSLQADLQTDISGQIGGLIMFAYLLFIMAIVVTDSARVSGF